MLLCIFSKAVQLFTSCSWSSYSAFGSLCITALARWYPKCSLFDKVRMRILPQSLLQRWHTSRFRTTYLQLSPLSVLQSFTSGNVHSDDAIILVTS